MYKICVYAIAKNEEQFVDRFMDHVKEADLVVVADTGSTDHTMQKLKDLGATVASIEVTPFRFDTSRNKCLDMVPDDIDICVSLDLDDVIEKGWRKHLEKHWKANTTRGRYLYNWSFYTDGTPAVQYTHQRIHARHGFRWIYPTHEVLEYLKKEEEQQVFIPGLVVNHHPDHTKNRSLNLPLLELAVKENPDSPRNHHYLGREYMFAQKWDPCIQTLKTYLSMPDATWDEERAASMRFIAAAYIAQQNNPEAKRWLFRAIAEAPHIREAYIDTAKLAYTEQDWDSVFFFASQSLRITEKSLSYVNEKYAWDATPYDLAALGSYYLGLKEKALAFSTLALQLSPDDARLQKNHTFYSK